MRAIALPCTLASVLLLVAVDTGSTADEEQTVDPTTGLIEDEKEQWKLVRKNCTPCHSGRLIAQQGLDRNGWTASIRRMQAKEGLADLGDEEKLILDYLTQNYGSTVNQSNSRQRRARLNQEPIESEPDSSKEPKLPTVDQAVPDSSQNGQAE